MKLAYQISSFDVPLKEGLTSMNGRWEDCFSRLHEAGYDGAEIMLRDPASVCVSELEKLSNRFNLDIPMICTGEIGGAGFTFSSTDESIRTEALIRGKKSVDIAAVFGAQVNVGRLRGNLDAKQRDITEALSVAGLRELSEYAAKKNVTIALEPVNGRAMNFILTTQEGMALADSIGMPNFSIMIDTQHMYLEDRDMYESVTEAKDYFSYVHLAASNRCYPGTGNVLMDAGKFVEQLRKVGYDGWISMEIYQRPDADTALKKSIEYMRKLV